MGCKCNNSNGDEEEILKKGLQDQGKDNNNNEDLLGYSNNNQDNLFQNGEDQKETLENKLRGRKPNSNINNNNYNENGNENENENMNDNPNNKYSDYPERIVQLINNIRDDPPSYADVIEDSIKNIIEDEDEGNPNKPKIIYKKKVKVALTKGEPAFRDAANYLRTLDHLEPLEFNKDICIPLPDTEEEMKDPTFLREQVRKIRENTQIDVFFKDLIKIPEVSSLLMIVDDTSKNASKKRLALLNKDLKYIGVTSKFIGKTFIAYFAFSK